MRRWIFTASALIGTTALVLACGVGTDCDFGLCAGPAVGSPEGGEGSADGDGPDAVTPAECVAVEALDTKDPASAPCVVNGYGVFVDAVKGSDTNAGTKESPVQTITGALAKTGNKRIYVCEGLYAEHVKVTRAVGIFGGFACATWAYSGNRSRIAPNDAGFGLQLAGLATAVVIADLEVVAIAGTLALPRRRSGEVVA